MESIGAVPSMVGAMARHLKSLRSGNHDHGMIHHMLNESENERFHLFICLSLKKPGALMKLTIAIEQFIFVNFFFFSYLLSPKYVQRVVGYLEEEAVHTYTTLLNQYDEGKLPTWPKLSPPDLALQYYELPENSSMRDVILSIRADESIHRDVNHKFVDLVGRDEKDSVNSELEVRKILDNEPWMRRLQASKPTQDT
jgi:hypothetical protein